MAAKLVITSSFVWTDGTDSLSAKGSQTIVPTGQLASESFQSISNSGWTSVNLGGVTPHYVFFENKDAANTITIASDNAGAHVVAVLGPKEAYPIASSNAAYWAQATTAASNLLVQVVPA